MPSIAIINYIFEDENFSSEEERLNYFFVKILTESGFDVDIYCKENKSKHSLNVNIIKLTDKDFFKTASQAVKKKYYDLTLSINFNMATNFVYLNEHSIAFKENIVKSKFTSLLSSLFTNKTRKNINNNICIQKEMAEKYKVIFTPSTILKNDLINQFNIDGEKIYILPPSICKEKDINIQNHTPFCYGFIGSGAKNNGDYLLFLALSSLKCRNFKLKIVYPDDEISSYIYYYLKLFGLDKKVEFIKYQSDLSDFYNSIDCLIIPSKTEPFGIYATDAMNLGKLVILSSRCGAKDLIEYGKNGFIFDISNNSIKNLKYILNYVLDNKDSLDNVRENAYKTAISYDYNRFKDEFLRILNKYFEGKERENVFD